MRWRRGEGAGISRHVRGPEVHLKIYDAACSETKISSLCRGRRSDLLWLLALEIRRDFYGSRLRRCAFHEFANRRQGRGDSFIVRCKLFVDARFEDVETTGEFLVGSEQLTLFHECADDEDSHLDGLCAVEHIGGLNGTVFGEGIGMVTLTAPV